MGAYAGEVLVVAPIDDVPGDDLVVSLRGEDATVLLDDSGGVAARWSASGPLAAGDLDGDGRQDLVLADSAADVSAVHAGAVYGWTGPVGGEHDVAEAAVRVDGEQRDDSLGAAVCAGDWDGDGLADLAALEEASRWRTYTDGGATAGARIELHASHGNRCTSGDLDGDGRDDLVLGAGSDGALHEGLVAVYTSPPPVDDSLWNAPVLLYGEQEHSEFGGTLVVADTDADGRDDLVVGADALDDAEQDQGGLYIYRSLPTGSVEAGVADLRITGEGRWVGLGGSVAVAQAGDRAWIAAGPFYYPPDGVFRWTWSEVFLIAADGVGETTTAGAVAVFSQDIFVVPPPVAAGDLDGDGNEELVVGSPCDFDDDEGVVWRVDLSALLGG